MKPRLYCPYCNAELRWGDKFCGNCGKPVEWSDAAGPGTEPSQQPRDEGGGWTCATCGTVNKPGVGHCRTCGSEFHAPSRTVAGAASGNAREAKENQRSSRRELKPLSLLNSWKPAVVFVAIVIAAVLLDMYVSRENIPAQSSQQATTVSQQPVGANMAVLPQIEDMERQVKANPDDTGLTLQLANFLSDNRFYDKAITYYQAYLRMKPKDTNARVDMGICYKESGQYDEAMRQMKKALEYDPTHLYATFNLGVVALDEGKMYMDQGKMDKANELVKESNDWFRKTVELSPTSDVGKKAEQLLSQHSNTQLPPSN